LAYIKDTFIAKGERAMKFLPSLWISIGLKYQYQQRLVPSKLVSGLMILTTRFKQLHHNSNRLTRNLITPFLPVWLKSTGYQSTLISSYFLVTQWVSSSYNTLSLNFRQSIYLIPRGLNTS
jgi:hypothetical protein